MSKYLDEVKHQMDMMKDKTCKGYLFLLKIYIEEQQKEVDRMSNELAAEHVKQNRLESGQDDLEKDSGIDSQYLSQSDYEIFNGNER